MTDQVLARVNAALNKGDVDAVELVFLEALEQAGAKFGLLRAIARACAEHGDSEKAAEFLAQLVEPAKQKGKEAHLDLLREICTCVPHKERWRRQFIAAFQEYYAGQERPLAFLKASEIQTTRRLEDAFAKLETLLMLREGGYLLHPGGWGIGKVREVSPSGGYLIVDLQEKRGHRVSIAAAASIFRALPDDHFLAYLLDRTDELKKKAEEDPLAIARILVQSFGGPMGVAALKEKLVPRVFPAEKWSSWWSKVKEAAKRDPHVRISTGAKPSIDIVETPVSAVDVADEILRTFATGGSKERMAAVRQCKGKKDQECLARILAAIRELEDGPAVELEKLLLRHALGDAELAAIGEFLRGRQDGPALVRGLAVTELARTAVKAIADAVDFDAFLPYFLDADMTTIGEAARACRKKSEEQFLAVLAEVMEQPRHYAWPFFWLYGVRIDPQWEQYLACFPVNEVLLRLLALLDYISRAEHREQARDLILHGRSLFGKEKYKTFRAMLGKVPKEALSDVYGQVQANRAIKESTRIVMAEHVAMLAPEAFRQEKEQTTLQRELTIDESIIYITPAGFKKRQSDFERLVHVELPKTFQEIGKAQEFGDLSENAEWSAALEKRDRQTQRASTIEGELKKARMIGPEMFHEGRVSLGCEVTVRDSTDNQVHTWRLLGPWDGDLRDGVLSYLSPVGRHLLGHQVGDLVTVTLPSGQAMYEVLGITRAPLEPSASLPSDLGVTHKRSADSGQ